MSAQMVVSSEIPVPKNDAVYLAAMHLYVTFGPFDATKHKVGFLEYVHMGRLRYLSVFSKAMFLPERWRTEKKIEAEVLKMYSEIPRKDVGAIKFQYYNLMRTLKRHRDF